MKYILSTMTNSVAYTFYEHVGDLPTPRRRITIHGGANVPSERSGLGEMSRDGSGKPIWTAAGLVTPVEDEAYEELLTNHVFQKHQAAGYVSVINHDIRGNNREIEKRAYKMETDGHALLTPDTLQQRVKVKVGAAEDKDNDFRL